MKQLFLFLAISLFGGYLHAQQLPLAIITAGGNASGSSGISTFVIGQPFSGNFSGTGDFFYEGLISPFRISIVTSNEDVTGISLTCAVYPNPTTDYVSLSISEYDTKDLQYTLYGLIGQMISKKNVTNDITQVQMTDLKPGVYLLVVTDNGRAIKKFKIVKSK